MKILWLVVGVVLLGGGFAAWKFGATAPAASPAVAPVVTLPTVSVTQPKQTMVRKIIEQPGRVEGFEQTPIHVKVAGYVKEWKADIGDRVEVGRTLAVLSIPEESQELARRQANVTLADAEIIAAKRSQDAADADVSKAQALVRQAEAGQTRVTANRNRYAAEYERQRKLRATGAVSQTDLDTAQDQSLSADAAVMEAIAAVESARASLASAVAAKVRATAQVAVAEARKTVSVAEVSKQDAILSYATVTAPFAGIVSARNIDTGHYVMPPTSGMAGAPLFVLVRTDIVRVFVDVPETEAALITPGHAVTLRLQALQDREVSGTVSRSSWALDPTTRSLRIQIDMPNPTGILRPGMYVTAKLTAERPNAWTVPASVVVTTDELPYAVRLVDGKAVKTPVKLGGRANGMVELLAIQNKPSVRGEPIPWDQITGTEELLLSRPPAWADGMAVIKK